MHTPESVSKNVVQKFLGDFEIQKDCVIAAWQLDLVIVKKKKKEKLESAEYISTSLILLVNFIL